jgi:hypothetical protein
MKDGGIKACVGIAGIVACYGIYSFNNPGADGLVFGSMLAAVSALAGYSYAAVKGIKK